MTAKELRQKYFDFFREKGHTLIPSASLLPENDTTVLFTTAGMHPLVPYLLGEKHPGGKRVVSAQKCVRTDDIEEVGDAVHHTFFEMLGNWSFGDYFKEDAIKWSWEFLTDKKWLGIDKNRLAISVFAGDADAPLDEESKQIWLSLAVPEERIAALPKKDNWWGPAGMTGPCGPDTEIFYWSGNGSPPAKFDASDKRWVEIWNDVFMEYNKRPDGTFEPLKQKNVDTGMGLERALAVLNGLDDNYRTELFWPIIERIEELSRADIHIRKNVQTEEEYFSNGVKYEDNKQVFRIITDHIKAATFIIGDERGISPSNTGQGYVVRRLIRRAIRYAKIIGIRVPHFTFLIAEAVIEIYKDNYPELVKNRDFIQNELVKEENTFVKTLERGLEELKKMKPKKPERITNLSPKSFFSEYGLDGNELFKLYSTYGFPIEMSLEEIRKLYKEYNTEQGVEITELSKEDENWILEDFHKSLKKHEELSRAAAAGKFKGGLSDHSETVTEYHTATHLLHAALRRVLGKQVEQKGSNITAERLRFDFSYPNKMTAEQLKEAEDLVNSVITRDYHVSCQEMSVADAKEQGAIGLFEGKYGDKVKVYSIGQEIPSSLRRGKGVVEGGVFSREICGGPHAARTGVLGKFKIIKEEAVAAGIRRIKAVLE